MRLEPAGEGVEAWSKWANCLPSTFLNSVSEGLNGSWTTVIQMHLNGVGGCDFQVMDNGTLCANVQRSFNLQESYVSHDLLHVDPRFQGKGFATRLLRNSFRIYQALGLTTVKLPAAVQAGSYVWAKCGFVPTAGSWPILRDEIRVECARIDDMLTYNSKAAIRIALGDEHTEAIWILADQDQEIGGVKLGRFLLRGKSWEGIFDLTNQEQKTRFDAYVQGLR